MLSEDIIHISLEQNSHLYIHTGHSDNFNETVEQAQLLKDSGVTIYSVGVGLTDEKELKLIASNETYVFTVDNYDRIDEIAGPLAGVTCACMLYFYAIEIQKKMSEENNF